MSEVADTNEHKQNIKLFRQEFLRELPSLAREYIDTARSEQTTAAMEKVMNTALKVIEGLQVDQAKNPYANLPVINFIIGDGGTVTTTIEPVAETGIPVSDVTDVEAKPVSPFGASSSAEFGTLPDNPLDLLDLTVDERAALDSLEFDLPDPE